MKVSIISVAVAFGLAASLASGGLYVPTNLVYKATMNYESGTSLLLTDGTAGNQLDTSGAATSYLAVKFGSEQTFNRYIFYECPGWIVAGKLFQVAKAGVLNPDPANNADWETIPGGTFSGVDRDGQSYYDFNVSYTRSGVRIVTTDKSNIPGNAMRPHEIWVWDNLSGTNNIAKLASSYDGYGSSAMNDENFADQSYLAAVGDKHAGYLWSTPQPIMGAVAIGGSGGMNELLKDYRIEYKDGLGNWQTVPGTAVSGNTDKINYFTFASTIQTTGLRLYITNSEDWGRISEFMVFIPEPTSLALLALGGLALLRRRK